MEGLPILLLTADAMYLVPCRSAKWPNIRPYFVHQTVALINPSTRRVSWIRAQIRSSDILNFN